MERRQGMRTLMVAVGLILCFAASGSSRGQFISHSDRTNAMLEGNWQSCRDAGGQYSERVYDGKWTGLPQFELHMGPFRDFALFQGIQDEHRDHESPDNLLRPHTVELRGGLARQAWDVAGLHFEAVLSGGSREECESWYITLKRSSTSSSH